MICSHCHKKFPPWEMVPIGQTASGAIVYVCVPCHS